MKFLALLFLILFSAIIKAQFWRPTSKPPNGSVKAIGICKNGDIYASEWGKLYKSANQGESWNLIADWTGEIWIWSIATDDSGYIFVGGAGGVYKSTDDGNSWIIKNQGLYPSVNQLLVTKTGDIWAATDSGVYLTTDSGDLWLGKNTGLPNLMMVYTIAINSLGYIFIGSLGAVIYKSTNYGNSWTSQGGSGAVNSIAITSNDYVFAGLLGNTGILRSTDNGETWEHFVNGLPQVNQDTKIAVNDLDYVFAGTTGFGVYRSTNFGDNWSIFNDGLTDLSILEITIDHNGYAYAGTALEGVFITDLPTTDVERIGEDILSSYYLSQNYPNPFNSSTSIKYSIPTESDVTLEILNVLGEQIALLVNGLKNVGTYESTWNANNISSGIYYYRLKAGDFVETKKMILLK